MAVAEARALVPGSVDPDAARASAERILEGDKFQPSRVPRPFAGLLEWLADRLRPLTDALGDWFEPVLELIDAVPFGRYLLGALALAVVTAGVVWLAGRRSRAIVAGAGGAGLLVDPAADPAALEAEAEAAESRGDLALAVRRRYEAGLLRLARAERLVLRPDTTPSSAADQVDDPGLHQLTADFEEVVYGDRPATAADVERSRRGWPELLGARAAR